MVISQMYRLGESQTVVNDVTTGLQNSGTILLSGGAWSDVTGGDGMECLIDYTNEDIQYSSTAGTTRLKTVPGQTSGGIITKRAILSK